METEDLTHAQAALGVLVSGLGDADWGRPSPCDDWDLAAVMRHLVVGERAFAEALAGRVYDLPTLSAEVARIAPPGLPAAYERGAVALRGALAEAEPGASFPTGLGPMPAGAVARLRTIEALAHGWDLARGAGRELRADDAVVERALEHSRALMEQLPAGRTPFAPPRPVADSAAPLDRLAALLGRRVDAG